MKIWEEFLEANRFSPLRPATAWYMYKAQGFGLSERRTNPEPCGDEASLNTPLGVKDLDAAFNSYGGRGHLLGFDRASTGWRIAPSRIDCPVRKFVTELVVNLAKFL